MDTGAWPKNAETKGQRWNKTHKWDKNQKMVSSQERIPGETGNQTIGEVPEQREKAHVLLLISMRVIMDKHGPVNMSLHTHTGHIMQTWTTFVHHKSCTPGPGSETTS